MAQAATHATQCTVVYEIDGDPSQCSGQAKEQIMQLVEKAKASATWPIRCVYVPAAKFGAADWFGPVRSSCRTICQNVLNLTDSAQVSEMRGGVPNGSAR